MNIDRIITAEEARGLKSSKDEIISTALVEINKGIISAASHSEIFIYSLDYFENEVRLDIIKILQRNGFHVAVLNDNKLIITW